MKAMTCRTLHIAKGIVVLKSCDSILKTANETFAYDFLTCHFKNYIQKPFAT